MGCVVNATPRPLYPQKWPGTHCIGGWVGPRAGLDGCGKSRPHRDTLPLPSIYTECAIPAHTRKAVSVQTFYRSTGFPNFGASTFLDKWYSKVIDYQPCAPAAFTPRKYSCYSCLLEAESAPGPATNEKSVKYQNICVPNRKSWENFMQRKVLVCYNCALFTYKFF